MDSTIHHLCIHKDFCIFDATLLPYGSDLIEEKLTEAINPLLDAIVPKIGDKDIIVCGDGTIRRMVARKLEDRLKRPVSYE
jgi:hypothetical protein